MIEEAETRMWNLFRKNFLLYVNIGNDVRSKVLSRLIGGTLVFLKRVYTVHNHFQMNSK